MYHLLVQKVDPLIDEDFKFECMDPKVIDLKCLLSLRPKTRIDSGVMTIFITLLNSQKRSKEMVFIDGSKGQKICRDYDDKDPMLEKMIKEMKDHKVIVIVCPITPNTVVLIDFEKSQKKSQKKIKLNISENQQSSFSRIKSWTLPIMYTIIYKALVQNIHSNNVRKQWSKVELKKCLSGIMTT